MPKPRMETKFYTSSAVLTYCEAFLLLILASIAAIRGESEVWLNLRFLNISLTVCLFVNVSTVTLSETSLLPLAVLS